MQIDSRLIWLAGLTVFFFAKIIYELVRKRQGNNPHPCQRNGERIARLEEAVENLEKGMVRIWGKLNGMK